MAEFILGMIGFILMFIAFEYGYYMGNTSEAEQDKEDRPDIPEEEKRQREKIRKGLNNIATYSGRKGRDRE